MAYVGRKIRIGKWLKRHVTRAYRNTWRMILGTELDRGMEDTRIQMTVVPESEQWNQYGWECFAVQSDLKSFY